MSVEKISSKDVKRNAREERLAAKLRENLTRRKSQSRERREDTPKKPDD